MLDWVVAISRARSRVNGRSHPRNRSERTPSAWSFVIGGMAAMYALGLVVLYSLRAYARHDGPWWLAFVSVWEAWWYAPLPVLALLVFGVIRRLRVRLALISVPVALWIAAFGELFVPSGVATQGPFLSVLTFNVRFDRHDSDRILQAILHANADVVALQELTTGLDHFLTDQLSTEYPYRLSRAADWPWGSGIYSRLPLTEIEDRALYGGLLDTQDVYVNWNGRLIRFLNFHPVPPSLQWSSGGILPLALPSNYEADIRHAQVADLVDRLRVQAGEPLILACDCNMDPTSDDYGQVTQFVQDGFREAGWGFGHTLYNNDQPNWSQDIPLVRIDYVFHSRHFLASEAQVMPFASSNHRPVLVRLAMP